MNTEGLILLSLPQNLLCWSKGIYVVQGMQEMLSPPTILWLTDR